MALIQLLLYATGTMLDRYQLRDDKAFSGRSPYQYACNCHHSICRETNVMVDLLTKEFESALERTRLSYDQQVGCSENVAIASTTTTTNALLPAP